MARTMQFDCRATRTEIVDTAVRLLRRTIAERSGVRVSPDAGEFTVRLDIQPGIGTEGFRIVRGDRRSEITGNDARGLLYGVGKFLRDCRFVPGACTPGIWQGESVPEKPVRAMYFASHFHNFYHDAPVAEVERYVEELALWSCNALSVWFDMHHFSGMDEPAARAMIERLRAILRAANRAGMGGALTTLANEAFAGSPKELRADWTAGHDGYHSPPGGHYHVEICPSTPGGLEQIVADRRQVFDAFRDLDLAYVWIWPYDQGGCTCPDCSPWGANGFLRAAEAEARLVREYWPAAKVVLSTWYFDRFIDGEWEGLAQAFARHRPDWVDCILADDYGGFPAYPLEHGVPGGFPAVGFPEISMERMWPWGGFGANPRPVYWQEHWRKANALLDGTFPYSEGIFEDLNKVMILQLEWDPTRTTNDIVAEYAAYEAAPAAVDKVTTAIMLLEQNMDHALAAGVFKKLWAYAEHVGDETAAPPQVSIDQSALYRLPDVDAPARASELLQEAETELTEVARTAWRWRILRLRADLDAALAASGGAVTAASEAAFAELIDIYHANHAAIAVAPPSLRTLRRLADQ